MKKKQQEETKEKPSLMARQFRQRMESLNARFNSIPHGKRKMILVMAGALIALLSGTILLNAIYGVPANPLSIDKITIPHDIYMKPTDTTLLTPVGKMKGEIDGEFEAFYLAVDKEGQVYINRDPGYSEDRYDKSKGWEPVTREQLAQYEKALHFIPHQKKGLKP